jgi:GT2 family glycosyltransferase
MAETKQIQSRGRVTDHSARTTVVIPVHNKWKLTEACLRSLAKTLAGKHCEIIVIDNASSDITKEACPALGQTLFGDFFRYHRAEHNLNFGPASNLGANMARGDFLLFLNNDTLAVPGHEDWYDKLLQDFSTYPDLAATGPVLLYPPTTGNPLGATVQHLGVFVTPTLKVGHLYEGIPVNSPLAAKRRFFQIITGACMLMPRALFLEYGGFDEGYVNGSEDIDLCTRLFAAGRRFTVNPKARLYHLCSQTPGRHSHEAANFRRFSATSMRLMCPDWHLHINADGFELQVSEWSTISPGLKTNEVAKIGPLLTSGDTTALIGGIRLFPLWYEGYAKLAALLAEEGKDAEAHSVRLALCQLRPVPDHLFALLNSAYKARDEHAISYAFSRLCMFCTAFDEYMQNADSMRAWATDIGLDDLAGRFRSWSDAAGDFREHIYKPFLRRLRDMTTATQPSPQANWAYTLWRELQYLPEQERRRHNPPPIDPSIAFSVLMPVYNPEPEHLREAVDSLFAQDWPHWELCMADDASPDPRIKSLLLELASRDPRIRVEFRQTNGHIAAATNTTLEMAQYGWVALMNQDDLLPPDALLEVAAAITANPDGLLFYSDEDKLFANGTVRDPYFKNNAWDWDLLLGQNMVRHVGVYQTERLRTIGGFRDDFPGSQDYDMLLRYSENIDSSKLIHIPRVLYHWRAHAGSTAAGIEAKPEALHSAVCAITEHLHRKGVDGRVEIVPDSTFYRVRYALPKPGPLASLVVDMGIDCSLGPAMAAAMLSKVGYGKLEILLLCNEAADAASRRKLERWATGQRQVRLLFSTSFSFGEQANRAVEAARGSLVGFLGKGLVPLSQDWLAEIVSRLAQPGVGVIGGKLILPEGVVYHIGHLADAQGRLFSLFRGLDIRTPGYLFWPNLARTVCSVDPRCLFTHKRLIDEIGGFEPGMGGASAMDFCLRLREKGLRTVTAPYAEFLFTLGKDTPWENGAVVSEPTFVKRWQGRIAPCHPCLVEGQGDWALYWNEGEKTACSR